MSDRNSLWSRPWLRMLLLATACAVLFAAPALYPSLYALGWIAFVPFILGLQRCNTGWQAYAFGFITGYLGWGLFAHSIAEFVQLFKGYSLPHAVGLASLYWLYCAQSFAIIAVVTHFARRANAMLWVFPTVLTLVLAVYPTIFPWQTGNSQSAFLVALQAVDIAGVSGLDFVIGVVNVLVAQALMGRPVFFGRSAVAAYTLVFAWFVYGVFSLAHWDNAGAAEETLAVGFVQPDEPPIIGSPGPRRGYSLSYPVEMDLTEQLVAAGAELVIWPELRNKHYYSKPYVKAAFERQIGHLESPLLLQAPEPVERDGKILNFNTATLIAANGVQADQYRKVKRIAIAEYLPLFDNSQMVRGWLGRYLGSFFGDFSAGPGPKGFDVDGITITPFICYEALFPGFIAAATAVTGGDILTIQSNNSWFGDTEVPYQHMSASVLRAVETRRPLVHAINNGLGGVVLPSGRIMHRTERHQVAGYLVELPYRKNAGATFYSRYPYWLLSVLGLALAVMLLRAWRSGKADQKQ